MQKRNDALTLITHVTYQIELNNQYKNIVPIYSSDEELAKGNYFIGHWGTIPQKEDFLKKIIDDSLIYTLPTPIRVVKGSDIRIDRSGKITYGTKEVHEVIGEIDV
jgi:hypothetical protein